MSSPVAIVGMGCRLPTGSGLARFWRALREGGDAIRVVPPDRWDAEALYDPDPTVPGRMNTLWGGFLDDVDGFDADFFGISTREAERTDPQQRITLEVAWEAIEDAGLAPARLAGSRTGVFMGVSTYDHGAALHAGTTEPEAYDGTGGAMSIVANRVSYCLDLRGPSVVVDTACSSSLVAVHLGCQALLGGDADLVLAGGVNVVTSPGIGMCFSRAGLMAPDGRCKPFDHRANGYVRGEGAGVVVLKPLAQALRHGDRVYAVILGGAVNQDGRTNGLTAPNRPAQEAVLRAAYQAAGVPPAGVDYVEAHGTGTAVGDPIEVAALASVLGGGRERRHPLRIGSVKSNLGHLEAAAGVAGLIKTALALHHRQLPPTIHFGQPNPLLHLDRVPVVVQDRDEPWPALGGGPATAGVSSFGFGGTNAHLVLASAPARTAPKADGTPARTPHLVPVSARSGTALTALAMRYADLARARQVTAAARPDAAGSDESRWLAGIVAAAALRRDHHRHRAAVVAASPEELAVRMAALPDPERAAATPGICAPRLVGARRPRVVLIFPGQGAQWIGMGKALAAAVPQFRDAMRRCDSAMSPWLGTPLWSDETGLVADGTVHVQPALFAMQVAMAETWRAWGVDPAAVVGHSMGEVAAAQVAGALSLDTAARVVCQRSRLLAELNGSGGLALVELGHTEAVELVGHRTAELSVAAVNGPRTTVLSGTEEALDEIVAALSGRGLFARRVAVEFAAHSPAVEPLQPRLAAALDGLDAGETRRPMYSTVTGEPVAGTHLRAGYWARNLREPVLFAPTIARLLADGYDTFVEVAPHPVLARSISEVIAEAGSRARVLSPLRRDDEVSTALHGLGELYAAGVTVDWQALHPNGAAHVDLPTHGWEHRPMPPVRHRAAPAPTTGTPPAPRRRGLLGPRVRVAVQPGLVLWALPLDLNSTPELVDHVVDDVPVVPGAYWLTAVLQASREMSRRAASGSAGMAVAGQVVLEDVRFTHPHALHGDPESTVVQLALSTTDGGTAFTIATCPDEGPAQQHAAGTVRPATPADAPAPELSERFTGAPLAVDDHYARLERTGLRYGPRFRGLVDLGAADGEAVARVRIPGGLGPMDDTPLHPALLDACLHTVAAAAGQDAGNRLPLPAAVKRVWARLDAGDHREVRCHARILHCDNTVLTADVTVNGEGGTPIWAADGMRIHLVPQRRSAEDGRSYEVRWTRADTRPAGSLTVTGPAAGGWLLLADRVGIAAALAERLTAAGGECALIDAADQHQVASAIASAARLRGVVDARAVDPAASPEAPVQAATRALWLVQAVAGRSWPDTPPRLWLLTSATQATGGSPAPMADLAPGGAAVWGLGRTVANELPELGTVLADLDSTVDARDLDVLAGLLTSAEPPGQVAIRQGEPLVPSLAPLVRPTAPVASLRHDRTYAITGGSGALGLRVAQWHADRGARHLLLISRRAPGPGAAPAIEQLRAGGVSVRVVAADTADAGQLRWALDGLGDRYPALAGVCHLAGVLDDALVTNLESEAVRAVMAGKAAGAWLLHEATRDQPVEMFVLFSSLAGLVGSPGQAAYAAASSFLDWLAHHRRAAGLPAVSIAWGPWAGEGLAVTAGGLGRLAACGVPPLEPANALELLDQAVGSRCPNVVAAAFRWQELSQLSSMPAVRQMIGDLAPARHGAPPARGAVRAEVLAAATAAERVHLLRDFLLRQVGQIVRSSEPIDPGAPLRDLGFDSLMAIELRDRLEASLDTRLSAALMFAYPTVDSLAEALLHRIGAPDTTVATIVGTPEHDVVGTSTGDPDERLSALDETELSTLLADELDALEAADRKAPKR